MGLFRRNKNSDEHVTHVVVHDATAPDQPATGGRVARLHGKETGGNGEDVAQVSPKTSPDGTPISRQMQPVHGTRVIAVANQKGGVGKTTTTINLAAYLALSGFRTLIIDLDPQGNATSGLGTDPNSLETCIYEVLMKRAAINSIIRPTGIEHLYLAPASFRLVGAQVELVNMISRETRMREIVADLKGEYSYVIIDCPPSLGLLTVNALTAAEELVIPVQCEYFALEGLTQLLASINEVKKYLNPDLKLAGLLMTMYDARTKIAQEVVEEVRTHFPGQVYTTIIPRSVRLSEAPSFGQPIAHYDALSRGAIAYKDLAEEVMKHG
jgi:chromosome partitioning protein